MAGDNTPSPAFRVLQRLGGELKLDSGHAYVVTCPEGGVLRYTPLGSRERQLQLPDGSVMIRDSEGFSLAVPGKPDNQFVGPGPAATAWLRSNAPRERQGIAILMPTDVR